jgi:hypothetical protein
LALESRHKSQEKSPRIGDFYLTLVRISTMVAGASPEPAASDVNDP